MARCLISFPSAAMVVPEGEWEAVGRDAHAVIDEAKAATSSAAASTKACRPFSRSDSCLRPHRLTGLQGVAIWFIAPHLLRFQLAQQFLRVKRPRRPEDGLPFAIGPLFSRAVTVEFEAIAVRVVEVHGLGDSVVVRRVQRVSALQDLPDRLRQFAPVGIADGDMVEAGMPGWRRSPTFAHERVQGDVVVIAPCREKDCFKTNVRAVEGNVESEDVVIEARGTLQIGDPKVGVADVDVWVYAFRHGWTRHSVS